MMSRAKRLSGRLASAGLSTVALLAYACAPGDSGVPEPVDIIGFVPGEDFKLANYAPIAEYFETLAASTDRMVLEQIGESTRGVPLYVAAISTPENLARVDRYKEITRTLAYARDPDGGYGTILAEDEARALAAKVAAMPPHALRQAKNLMRQGRSISYDTALEMAANTQALMHLTDDHMEGIDALLEKRAPRFEGR